MSGVDAHDPDEFSAGQWPDWSFWKSHPDGSGVRVVVATFMAVASLALFARAQDIAHGTSPPLPTSLAIGAVACYVLGCMLAQVTSLCDLSSDRKPCQGFHGVRPDFVQGVDKHFPGHHDATDLQEEGIRRRSCAKNLQLHAAVARGKRGRRAPCLTSPTVRKEPLTCLSAPARGSDGSWHWR